nr:transposon TX1 putative 149 kDa protein [Tanacetum cinerariifolium]
WKVEAEMQDLSNEELGKWLESRKAWITKENEKANLLRQKACVRWDVEEKEVWDAVCGYGSDKALGPDGFNFKYIKRIWGVIKADVLAPVKWFWEKGEFSRRFNVSFVNLIPKLTNPLRLGDFRPISLVGSLYKIIAKLLAERGKKVIRKVIDEV